MKRFAGSSHSRFRSRFRLSCTQTISGQAHEDRRLFTTGSATDISAPVYGQKLQELWASPSSSRTVPAPAAQ